MCWLVFVGVSGYRGDPMLAFTERGFVAEPTDNPSVAAMGASATKFAIGDGHCACSLYYDTAQTQSEDPQVLRRRYARKGWTASRIERAITAHLTKFEANEKARLDRNVLPEIVAALTGAKANVFLLAHSFRGSFDVPFEISSEERLRAAEFAARGGQFTADTLVAITATGRDSSH
jgi:hypothetical protein